MNRARLASIFALAVVPAVVASCSGDDFSKSPSGQRLVVEFVDPPNTDVGTRLAGLPLPIQQPRSFEIRVSALRADGSPDTTFNRYVRLSSKPGSIAPLVGDDTEGRNVLVKGGISAPITVQLSNVFGVTYILAEDIGYVPVDPLRKPPPQCADGIDNDGDGFIDFPADDGCAFANDDSELGGSYAEGASPPIFFSLPRVADVRGLSCTDPNTCQGGGSTPYSKQAIQLDTGYHEFAEDDGSHSFRFDFSTIVTRISAGGFFVTDLAEDNSARLARGFNDLYTFNFNAPPDMKVCDRLKTFAGTPSEFYGFTQMAYPTWTLEQWDPSQRHCMVPDPVLLLPDGVSDPSALLRQTGRIVRVETLLDKSTTVRSAMVTPKFGRESPPCQKDGDFKAIADLPRGVKDCDLVTDATTTPPTKKFVFKLAENATNCDFDGNGSISYSNKSCVACTGAESDPPNCDPGGCLFPEGDCSQACSGDPECTEYSNYKARSTFRITLMDVNHIKSVIQADGTAASFDPVANRGKSIRSFAGTLTYFSGGAQYTIEARCADDIVLDPNGAPLKGDVTCKDTSECPDSYECLALGDGTNACRKRDRAPNEANLIPPHLPCVFPRTSNLDNPQ